MIGDCNSCDRTGVTLFRSGHCLICTEARDRFAAAALQGILSAGPVYDLDENESNEFEHMPQIDYDEAASEAYTYANAMMIERARNAEQHDW